MNVFAAATWPHETTGGEPSVDGTFGRHNDNLASFGCRGHTINRYIYTGVILQHHETIQGYRRGRVHHHNLSVYLDLIKILAQTQWQYGNTRLYIVSKDLLRKSLCTHTNRHFHWHPLWGLRSLSESVLQLSRYKLLCRYLVVTNHRKLKH